MPGARRAVASACKARCTAPCTAVRRGGVRQVRMIAGAASRLLGGNATFHPSARAPSHRPGPTRLVQEGRTPMRESAGTPSISVIIPTYNRRELVRRMLNQLARQDVPTADFEVIVSDDGSRDDTRTMVDSFAGRLRLTYHYQEDRGMRVSLARNCGARLARAPLLLFVDAGAMMGPDFVRRHLAAHADPAARQAVAGYAWGYNPEFPPGPVLAKALSLISPQKVLERFGENPALTDIRHVELAKYGFDLERVPLPWRHFYTINCSLRAQDFWAAGGFDESFAK